MSSKDKLLARFKSLPSDFTFDELERLLSSLGYAMKQILEELTTKNKI